jgi:hypothetical protein
MDEPVTLTNPTRSFFLLTRFLSRAANDRNIGSLGDFDHGDHFFDVGRQDNDLRHGLKNRAVLFVDDDAFFLDKNIAIADGSRKRVDQLFSCCDVIEEPIRGENEVSTKLGSLESGILISAIRHAEIDIDGNYRTVYKRGTRRSL